MTTVTREQVEGLRRYDPSDSEEMGSTIPQMVRAPDGDYLDRDDVLALFPPRSEQGEQKPVVWRWRMKAYADVPLGQWIFGDRNPMFEGYAADEWEVQALYTAPFASGIAAESLRKKLARASKGGSPVTLSWAEASALLPAAAPASPVQVSEAMVEARDAVQEALEYLELSNSSGRRYEAEKMVDRAFAALSASRTTTGEQASD